jgi:GNAT superfamily N-acetyltransferase
MTDEELNVKLKEMRLKWEPLGVSSYAYAKNGDITLSEIKVRKDIRNQGLGTKFMEELKEFANQNKLRIILTPSTDFGASSKGRLESFYKGLGFYFNKGRNKDYRTRETMIYRYPNYSKNAETINWYKISQIYEQQDFGFDIPKVTPRPLEESDEYKNIERLHSQGILDDIEESHNHEELIRTLNRHRVSWKEVNLQEYSIIIFLFGKKHYVIDDFEYPSPKEAHDWIWGTSDSNLDSYLTSKDYSSSFWDDVTKGSVVYHATEEENKELILKNGLLPMDKSRGINNRSTGAAVFCSFNPHEIASYGDTIFEINLGAMKQDGYMPNTSQEIQFEEAEKRNSLAHLLGVDDFYADDGLSSDGISGETIIIYGKIPAKYLKVLE